MTVTRCASCFHVLTLKQLAKHMADQRDTELDLAPVCDTCQLAIVRDVQMEISHENA